MSSFLDRLGSRPALALALSVWVTTVGAADFTGVGRNATPNEIQAWNIDVRPDFKGLPAGRGSVSQGQDLWEGKCASCHGTFGESGDYFSPLIGGTSKDDVVSGHAKRLTDPAFPGRTMIMKLSTVSTLWDFIHRAMPWTAPKSLSNDEVYAVTAYLLNLAGVVDDDFELSDQNIADVQKRLPNRNGMTTHHSMWSGHEFGGVDKPDVQGSRCMKNCAVEPKVGSFIPDYARNSHGNLKDQMRGVGAVRGADTEGTPGAAKPAAEMTRDAHATEQALMKTEGCAACHAVDHKVLGPAFNEIAKRHADQADLLGYLTGRVRGGSTGVWGAVAMPAQGQVSDASLQRILQWMAAGAPP